MEVSFAGLVPEQEDILTGKLVRVVDYMNSFKGNTYGPNLEGGRDKMAIAVCFQMMYVDLGKKLKALPDKCTEKDFAVINRQLDLCINMYNATPATMILFWEGKQPINPKKVPFNVNGKIIDIDLFEVTEITV